MLSSILWGWWGEQNPMFQWIKMIPFLLVLPLFFAWIGIEWIYERLSKKKAEVV